MLAVLKMAQLRALRSSLTDERLSFMTDCRSHYRAGATSHLH
jgi:hypothetical protein